MPRQKSDKPRKSFRLPEELINIIQEEADRRGVTFSEIATEFTQRGAGIPSPEPIEKGAPTPTRLDPTTKPVDTRLPPGAKRWRLPIGHAVYSVFKPWIPGVQKPEYGWRMDVWTCPPEHVGDVVKLCEPWVKNGFTLHKGAPVTRDRATHPQGRMCRARHGAVKWEGDIPLWFTIDDPQKALEYMRTHTDIPVAVLGDAVRNTDDDVYAEALERARELFVEYYETGKPITLNKKQSQMDALLQDV